jgi:hypothetical protein
MQATIQQERTCRSLFNEFRSKYSIDEVKQHAQLSRLYDYLEEKCSMANGQYVHEPNKNLKELLEKFLDYNPQKSPQANCPRAKS